MMAEINWFVDNIIWVYTISVLLLIWSYWSYIGNKKKRELDEQQNFHNRSSISYNQAVDWEINFRECMQGLWKQVESENLDNFGLLSNQSKMRRTLGALAFYRVRHRISYKHIPPIEGNDEPAQVKFCLLRDLGEGMQEWSMEAVIGTSRETAEPVEYMVDTPGCETRYRYRVWVDATPEGGGPGELLMESEPVEVDEDSITTLQVRTLENKNRMKMEWHGYNEVSGLSCGMVSYFDRIPEKQ